MINSRPKNGGQPSRLTSSRRGASGRVACYLSALSILCAAGCSFSHSRVERTVITAYGTFEMSGATTQQAGGTTAGQVHMAGGMKLLSKTDRIARAKGTAFGYQFVVEGEPKGSPLAVAVTVIHPPFQRPGASQSSDRESWGQTVGVGVPSYAGYSLDEEWEMVPGPWTVQVFYGPRLLVEKAFAVE